MRVKSKIETIDEYLARGGSIKIMPQASRSLELDATRTQAGTGISLVMSLDEADLFYGEGKPLKKKPSIPNIDINLIPEALRKKFIAKLLNEGGYGEESYEESFEEDEEDSFSEVSGEEDSF